jgi:type I restriction enzyme R subunit
MKPEDAARTRIDDLLKQAGWVIQDRNQLNLGAGRGVAVREFALSTGDADYLLFVDRRVVGTVEAKKVGETLVGVEEQSAKYRVGLPPGMRAARDPLPFTYETTGIETRFTSFLDPEPRSRQVFAFHRPATLAEWLEQAPADIPNDQNDTLRARLRRMPPLPTEGLRDCQVEAITHLERSLADNHPRALVQMATGSGKTYMAVSSVYRLIKFGGAKRIVFLVDRANLGRQTLKEFQQYVVPGDGRKFTELYNVQLLRSNTIDDATNVVITTIQRLYSMLAGEPEFDAANEEMSLYDLDSTLAGQPPKEVRYNPVIPIETFDFIISDECHRSIYHLWRGVLEYFDSFIIGLTATPNKATFGFFHRNLVMEYGRDRAVADGVNVDFDVFEIRTEITQAGSKVDAGLFVDKRDRQTRQRRWEQLDEELTYDASQLDRAVVAEDQLRTVIRTFRDKLLTEIFPGRQTVPKTLIFAKDDSHADDIVQMVREEFAKGNEFCQKITYKVTGRKPEDLIADFRNSYYPRIAVTVDMISTGTDIKPLEVLLFMRMVKSHSFFEQMKGRGSRTIADTDFQAVTPDAKSKDHFVLVDAVGVVEQQKSDEPPLERKRSVPLEKLLDAVALGAYDDDTLASLAARLGRLAGRLTPQEDETITREANGRTPRALAQGLVAALDPDRSLEAAQVATGQEEPGERAIQQARERLIEEAVAPFDSPALRSALTQAQRRDEQTIDLVSQDTLMTAGWDAQAEERARSVVTTFRDYIEAHRDEITALQVLYSRPRHAALRFSDIRQLAEAIQAPPLGLTTDTLWQAYAQLDRSRVRGARATRMLTDLVALVRYTLARDDDQASVLEPWAETVERRFAAWLAEQERERGQPFSDEQRRWLAMIRDHVAASLAIDTAAFDEVPFNQYGGLGKAYQLFGAELPRILTDLNERLVA